MKSFELKSAQSQVQSLTESNESMSKRINVLMTENKNLSASVMLYEESVREHSLQNAKLTKQNEQMVAEIKKF